MLERVLIITTETALEVIMSYLPYRAWRGFILLNGRGMDRRSSSTWMLTIQDSSRQRHVLTWFFVSLYFVSVDMLRVTMTCDSFGCALSVSHTIPPTGCCTGILTSLLSPPLPPLPLPFRHDIPVLGRPDWDGTTIIRSSAMTEAVRATRHEWRHSFGMGAPCSSS